MEREETCPPAGAPMSRRLTILAFVATAVLVAGQLVGAPVGASTSARSAATDAPSLNVSSLPEAADYFTDTWRDPLDFSNPEDFDTTTRRSKGVVSSLHDGVLDFTTFDPWGRLFFADSVHTDLPALGHRQSTHQPIATWKYRRLSMMAYWDRNSVGYIYWNHCGDGFYSSACQGYKAFRITAGWQWYDLDLTGTNDRHSHTYAELPTSISGAPWGSGDVVQLSLQPGGQGVAGVHGLIGHMRLYEPGNLATVTGDGGELWWDLDSNTANNGQSQDSGLMGLTTQGPTAVEFGGLPPGSYRFETRSGSTFSAPSVVTPVNAAPVPVVVDPDISGAGDWFAEVRGNPMDFGDPGDVFTMYDGQLNYRNMWANLAYGLFNGWSVHSDPQVFLSDAWTNGPPVDATEWHRLTWRVGYDGSYGTDPEPGEGLDARFCWQGLQGQVSCSKDVFPPVAYTTYSVSLKSWPPNAIEPGGYSGLGWGGPGSPLTQLLRFDPHEDPGGRGFHLDDVRLSHDDRVPYGGSFPIRFYDAAWEQGTVADVYIDGDVGGSLGTPIATNVPVANGENSVPWSGQGFAPGTYGVNVVLRDPRGNVRLGASTGPVDLPGPQRWTPFGVLEGVVVSGRTIAVGGWAVDPDGTRWPIRIHVYVDGVGYDVGVADNHHFGLSLLRKDLGAWHGFLRGVPAEPGTHDVCVYALNFGYGDNAGLGCRQVVVK